MALIDHEHPVDVSPPWEPNAVFGLRLLAWPERDKAQLEKTRRSFRVMEGVAPEVMAALPQRDAPTEPVAGSEDPLDDYDLGTLLEFGLVSWSYDRELNAESRKLLDDRTAKWLGRQIVDLNSWSEEDVGNSNGRFEATTSAAPDTRKS